jgi:hypothetical protein
MGADLRIGEAGHGVKSPQQIAGLASRINHMRQKQALCSDRSSVRELAFAGPRFTANQQGPTCSLGGKQCIALALIEAMLAFRP